MQSQHKKELIATYDAIAEFDSKRKIRLWQGIEKLKGIISQGSILDLGCGDGRVFELFKDNTNITYIGLDISPKSIEIAKKKYQKYPNASFLVGDCRDRISGIARDPISAILLIGSYHHIFDFKERKNILLQCKQSLKKDGTIVLTVWNIWHPQTYRHLIKSILNKITLRHSGSVFNVPYSFKIGDKTLYRTYHLFFPWQIKKEIIAAGFKITKTEYWRRGKNLVLFCKKPD